MSMWLIIWSQYNCVHWMCSMHRDQESCIQNTEICKFSFDCIRAFCIIPESKASLHLLRFPHINIDESLTIELTIWFECEKSAFIELSHKEIFTHIVLPLPRKHSHCRLPTFIYLRSIYTNWNVIMQCIYYFIQLFVDELNTNGYVH